MSGDLVGLPPTFRRLRAYAFDPSLSLDLDTAVLNETVLKIPWEEELGPGPVGEYLEVVDADPASNAFYPPVNLNDPRLLGQDGLPPSEGNPQFHQQMVYAVAMMTIRNFEQSLGRLALWSPRFVQGEDGKTKAVFIRRLRCYPHALREANAFYSPEKKALLFGYFPASRVEPGRNLPGGVVFTCLSHDIIAHETTHALLDGLHKRFIEASNPDALAFHEAFADIVALFQHFTFPESVRHQIARTQGNLANQNLLGELAQQFGQAIGNRGALRSAINQVAPLTGQPDPRKYEATQEPHERGAILVAAVFDAFLAIFKARIADLLRIATGGSGVLPQGELHSDLVNRLAIEATKSASHVLRMCIRALDYCPPVDVTFGEYLRALITADEDLVPDDDKGYRIAVIEAFRRRGIYPPDVRSLSIDSLRWQKPTVALPIGKIEQLRLGLTSDREEIWRRNERNQYLVWAWLKDKKAGITGEAAWQMGLALGEDAPPTIEWSDQDWLPKVEVHSVRPARRVGPDGQQLNDLVIEITQSRKGYLTAEEQAKADRDLDPSEEHFAFRGGCTLLVDMSTKEVRYCIGKNILSEKRLQQQREYLSPSNEQTLGATYFGGFRKGENKEPFALLHRGY
ncbi:hypothetical protein [Methylocaldum sp.]|uniref:hypothetical protein n=1 Tax=Methylocaldum sp. TaxID=1969727 RepID=UPI002D6CA63A|nr:hypothetical protein [Methylocaldum sp.]HYE33989.1 hypothetical protein [Methylocaldum sp.]